MFAIGHVNFNRLLVTDLRDHKAIDDEHLRVLSEKLCNEAFIDDVIVLERSSIADARMRIFGADGREAEFCGNGALLSLQLLFNERQSAGDPRGELDLETASGVKHGIRENNGRVAVEVGIVTKLDDAIDDRTLSRFDGLGVNFEGFRLSGEPHLVVSAPPGSAVINQSRQAFEAMARSVAQLVEFDGGVNVTLILVQDDCGLCIRTYERGVQRMTESCGSGAVAAASTRIYGSTCPTITVISPGGEHHVWTDPDARHCWLSAMATHLRWNKFPELSARLRGCSLQPVGGSLFTVSQSPEEPEFGDPDVRRFLGLTEPDDATPDVKQTQLGDRTGGIVSDRLSGDTGEA